MLKLFVHTSVNFVSWLVPEARCSRCRGIALEEVLILFDACAPFDTLPTMKLMLCLQMLFCFHKLGDVFRKLNQVI